MTDEELTAIEEQASRATPGPWRTSPYAPGAIMLGPVDTPRHVATCGPASVGTPADAAFIAAMREGVPTLVAEVRTLRGLLAEALPYAWSSYSTQGLAARIVAALGETP